MLTKYPHNDASTRICQCTHPRSLHHGDQCVATRDKDGRYCVCSSYKEAAKTAKAVRK